MTDKFISDYTEETSPAPTDMYLIDQGSGSYKKVSHATASNGLSVVADVNGGTLFYNTTAILSWTTGGE